MFSGGGSVVQSVAPWAAQLAGQYGANAANTASNDALQGINSAINAINSSYSTAVTALQPYTQTGVQALDQLNEYLGLSPYTPAVAPTAPTQPGNVLTDPLGNQSIAGLAGQAQSIASNGQFGGYNSADPLHSITSIAAQLANSGQLNASQQNFLNNYTNAGGTFGETGTQFGTAINTAAQNTYNQANQQYQLANANYNQDQSWATQYGTPLTADQITQNITNQPGYQAQLNQGTQAINNDASAKGYLGSGQMLQELMSYGQNTLSQYYNNTLNHLAGIASAGQSSANNIAGLTSSQGNSLANLYNSLGQDQANASLAGANSWSQALLAANPQYTTVGQSSNLSGIGSLLSGAASVGSSLGLF